MMDRGVPGQKRILLLQQLKNISRRNWGKILHFIQSFLIFKDVINALHEKRIKDIEALDQVNDISNKVVMKTGDGIPEKLINKNGTPLLWCH